MSISYKQNTHIFKEVQIRSI